MKLARTFLSVYASALRHRPYTTQICSSAVLWGLGDLLAQRIEKSDSFNARRAAITTGYGSLFAGVVGHTWYLQLDKLARRVAVPATPRFIATKVVMDTLIFGPLHVAAFFVVLTFGEGGNTEDVASKLRTDFLPTFGTGLAFWPTAQAINFRFVPLKFQLLFVNALTIGDATFMSWVAHNKGWFGRALKAIGLTEPSA